MMIKIGALPKGMVTIAPTTTIKTSIKNTWNLDKNLIPLETLILFHSIFSQWAAVNTAAKGNTTKI